MIVTVGEAKFKVDWHYNRDTFRRSVSCRIWGISFTEVTYIGGADATCSHKDQYFKEKGRRISLAKALKSTSIIRSDRAIFWEAYRTMGGSVKWEINGKKKKE